MAYDPHKPFNDLPLLPPKEELETKPVLKSCIAANTALAELKGAGGLIPNQTILINSIPLQEAQSSSEIENIVTTQDELFRAAAGAEDLSDDPVTKEVLRYRSALKLGGELLKAGPFQLSVLQQICSHLKGEEMAFRSDKLVRLSNPTTKEVIYTPPLTQAVIQQKLENLEAFLTAPSDLDPLVQMAVAHYQFEAIHPFEDGNGRTGRILNLLLLVDRGLLEIPVLYLSRFIIQNKQDYYSGLLAVTETQQWEPWLLYMLEGVTQTARWTTARIQAIRQLFDETCELAREKLPSRVYSKELIELIFEQPYCKGKFVVDRGLAKRQTAADYLKELEKAGLLTSEKVGRETIYRNPSLLEILKKGNVDDIDT
ncbi:Fic family protein [Blastopirellula sp. JC732]|uniref:Fic family protein n=1 Tax=Blastopirellula sediminis TaxID=2894196 RepID=A0A9X1SFL4_9BACT|nr:Fic/DOC family N-terminal domain-containing protein [Blastopirellula sediminis]MCC9608770.1 Fic family protein [Blastopirellula sediminis]MCC9628453.1 Fic family protein [Blastopirellula sediminis]